MRLRDILHEVLPSDTHPVTVVVPLHPTQWSQFAKFIANSPEFRLLSKLMPDVGKWIVYVGCTSEAASKRLNEMWGR